ALRGPKAEGDGDRSANPLYDADMDRSAKKPSVRPKLGGWTTKRRIAIAATIIALVIAGGGGRGSHSSPRGRHARLVPTGTTDSPRRTWPMASRGWRPSTSGEPDNTAGGS